MAFVQITLAIDDLAWNAFQRYRLVANGKITLYTRSYIALTKALQYVVKQLKKALKWYVFT